MSKPGVDFSQTLPPFLAPMEDSNDLKPVATQPVWDRLRCARYDEFPRTGDPTRTAQIGQLGEPLDSFEQCANSISGLRIVLRDLRAEMNLMLDGLRRPDDGHTAAPFVHACDPTNGATSPRPQPAADVAFLVPRPLQYVAGILPAFWPMRALWSAGNWRSICDLSARRQHRRRGGDRDGCSSLRSSITSARVTGFKASGGGRAFPPPSAQVHRLARTELCLAVHQELKSSLHWQVQGGSYSADSLGWHRD